MVTEREKIIIRIAKIFAALRPLVGALSYVPLHIPKPHLYALLTLMISSRYYSVSTMAKKDMLIRPVCPVILWHIIEILEL